MWSRAHSKFVIAFPLRYLIPCPYVDTTFMKLFRSRVEPTYFAFPLWKIYGLDLGLSPWPDIKHVSGNRPLTYLSSHFLSFPFQVKGTYILLLFYVGFKVFPHPRVKLSNVLKKTAEELVWESMATPQQMATVSSTPWLISCLCWGFHINQLDN